MHDSSKGNAECRYCFCSEIFEQALPDRCFRSSHPPWEIDKGTKMNKVALAGYTKELRKRTESRKALPANGRQRSKLTWPFVMQPTSGLKGVCPSARVCFRRKTSEQKVQHTFGIAELAEFGGVPAFAHVGTWCCTGPWLQRWNCYEIQRHLGEWVNLTSIPALKHLKGQTSFPPMREWPMEVQISKYPVWGSSKSCLSSCMNTLSSSQLPAGKCRDCR